MFLHGTNLIPWCQDSFLRDNSVLLCLFLLWFKWSYLYLNIVSRWTGNSPRIIQLERVMYHKCHEGVAGEETVVSENTAWPRGGNACVGLAWPGPDPTLPTVWSYPCSASVSPHLEVRLKRATLKGWLLVPMEKKNYKYLQCLSRKVQHCYYSKMAIRSYGGNNHFTFLLTNH